MLLHVEHTNVADMKAMVAGSFWQNFVNFVEFQQLCDVGLKLVVNLMEGDLILQLLVGPRRVLIQRSVKRNQNLSNQERPDERGFLTQKIIKSDFCLLANIFGIS